MQTPKRQMVLFSLVVLGDVMLDVNLSGYARGVCVCVV